jgi:hypothetical protein
MPTCGRPPGWLECPGVGLLSPVFVAGAEYLGSGRRVRGREAIACDAEGALDAAARTGTLVRGGRRLLLLHQVHDEGACSIRCACRAGPARGAPDVCASLLIASGASDIQVAHQMGHRRIETTKNIYSHLFAQDRISILDA